MENFFFRSFYIHLEITGAIAAGDYDFVDDLLEDLEVSTDSGRRVHQEINLLPMNFLCVGTARKGGPMVTELPKGCITGTPQGCLSWLEISNCMDNASTLTAAVQCRRVDDYGAHCKQCPRYDIGKYQFSKIVDWLN
jgi:hypothetical protein